jgi:hypothetical protein
MLCLQYTYTLVRLLLTRSPSLPYASPSVRQSVPSPLDPANQQVGSIHVVRADVLEVAAIAAKYIVVPAERLRLGGLGARLALWGGRSSASSALRFSNAPRALWCFRFLCNHTRKWVN